MARVRRLSVTVCVAVIATVALIGPATAVPNNKVDVIRGQGSDTTIDLMRHLDEAFNATAGCNVLSNPQRLDHECGIAGPPYNDPADASKFENWDHDVGVSFSALGSSNGIRMLTNFGLPGNSRIEYARSSRAKTGSDNAALRFIAYAKDALAPVDFQGTVDPTSCDVDRTGGPTGLFPEYDDSGPNAIVTGNGTWNDGPDADTCNDATVATSVKFVTNQQVKDIHLNCTVNTWDDLDSSKPAVPIIVWTSQAGSGTRGSWDGFIGGSTDACIPAAFKNPSLSDGNRVIFEHDATPIVNCATDDDGAGPEGIDCPDDGQPGYNVHYTQSIFHYGVGAHSVSGTDPLGQGADLLSLCSNPPTCSTVVAPTPANIKSGAYLYSRDVFNVYRKEGFANAAPDFVKDYVGEQGWICKVAAKHVENPKTNVNYRDEIEEVIQASGFVPLDEGAIGGGIGGNSHCRASG